MRTLSQIMISQMQLARPLMFNKEKFDRIDKQMKEHRAVRDAKPKKLEDHSRAALDSYMIDCHGYDAEQVAEWETKADLCQDIRSFGWETEAMEYLA